MIQWYVKDLSKLTKVSVQTLHHYDRIGLLAPSVRLANGYRVYSEKDLLKLQQIVALKFFGFELSQIKLLLAADIDVIDHFAAQIEFLEDKAKALLDASQALKAILPDCGQDKSIPWESIIKLIEVYRMTRQLEKTWAGKVLNENELREYVNFEQELPARFNNDEEKKFKQEWADLVSEINANVDKDPTSEFGVARGKRCMDWVNSLYGKKYISLRNAIWEKGFKGGQLDNEYGLSPAGVAWLDEAIDAYYRGRIYNILNQVGSHSSDDILASWMHLLDDMYGDDQLSKDEVIKASLIDANVSQAAKNWLKKISQ